jgi:hypothetical protein
MTMNKLIKMVAAGLLLAACSKNDVPASDRGTSAPAPNPTVAAAPTTPDTPSTAAATAANPATAAAGTAIPTPEDYESTAAKTVTADTLDAQLNQLEKEIAATPK